MSNSPIENIYFEFKTTYQERPEFTIDFYNKNSIHLNNLKSFKNKEELKYYIELIWQYLNANFKKHYYNEIIHFAHQPQQFIDREIGKLNANELKDNWYYGIVFFVGQSNYNIKDYKTSTPIFKQLVKVDSKNDLYIKWLRYSQYGQQLWIVKTVWIVSICLILITMFAGKYIPNKNIKIAMDLMGILLLVGNWSYDYYIKRSFRKSKFE